MCHPHQSMLPMTVATQNAWSHVVGHHAM
eukprot:COSAG06_NODE_63436_length_262_cov_0.638037_2_plen_28_part_01